MYWRSVLNLWRETNWGSLARYRLSKLSELFIAAGDPQYFGRISTLRLICYTAFCVELNGLNNKHMCRRLGVLFLFLSCCVFLDGARWKQFSSRESSCIAGSLQIIFVHDAIAAFAQLPNSAHIFIHIFSSSQTAVERDFSSRARRIISIQCSF